MTMRPYVSLPGLSDPEEAAASQTREGFAAALEAQIKLLLLLSEQIVLSDGFLYDNPGMWQHLLNRDFVALLTTPPKPSNEGGQPPVILFVAEPDTADLKSLFQSWLFRKRPMLSRPSAFRTRWETNGIDPAAARADLVAMSAHRQPSLVEYARRFGLDNLEAAEGAIQTVLEASLRVKKIEGRHGAFRDALREYFAPGTIAILPETVDPGVRVQLAAFAQHLDSVEYISTGEIQSRFELVWGSFDALIRNIRMESFARLASGRVGAVGASFTASPPGAGAIADALVDTDVLVKDRPRELLLLRRLSFADVLVMRQRPDFLPVVRALAQAGSSWAEYQVAIDTKWGPWLQRAVSEVRRSALGTQTDQASSGRSFVKTLATIAATGIGSLIRGKATFGASEARTMMDAYYHLRFIAVSDHEAASLLIKSVERASRPPVLAR